MARPPIELTPENDAGKWNISPQVGSERDALRQLFGRQDFAVSNISDEDTDDTSD